MTEGTASAWERARYEWDDEWRRVDVTTLDSKVFGPGGGSATISTLDLVIGAQRAQPARCH